MATLPSYVGMALAGISEKHPPIVHRTDMERGVAKQRRFAADPQPQLTVTLTFDSRADADAFEAWFYSGEGMGWFDFIHPRTLQTVSGRFMGGDIGASTPANKSWGHSTRQVVIEYVRTFP